MHLFLVCLLSSSGLPGHHAHTNTHINQTQQKTFTKWFKSSLFKWKKFKIQMLCQENDRFFVYEKLVGELPNCLYHNSCPRGLIERKRLMWKIYFSIRPLAASFLAMLIIDFKFVLFQMDSCIWILIFIWGLFKNRFSSVVLFSQQNQGHEHFSQNSN